MSYDRAKVQFQTSQALTAIEAVQKRAARLTLDPKPEERQAARMCRLCYCSPGLLVPGEHMCSMRGQPGRWSGQHRSVCVPCAACGADRELREGRRK